MAGARVDVPSFDAISSPGEKQQHSIEPPRSLGTLPIITVLTHLHISLIEGTNAAADGTTPKSLLALSIKAADQNNRYVTTSLQGH